MFSFRSMTKDDEVTVLEMMKVFYDSPAVLHKTPIEVLKRDIEDCVGDMPFIEGYIAVAGEETAGYAMVAKSYSTEYGGLCIWIEDLYFKEPFRHQGLGSLFFNYLEAQYKGRAVRYRLEVTQENRSAIDAYLKNGFQPLPYLEMTKEI